MTSKTTAPRIDHLADRDVGRTDHAAHRCDQGLAAEAAADSALALLERGKFDLRLFDVFLRDAAFQLLEPHQAAFEDAFLRSQFGQGRQLSTAFEGGCSRLQPGQNLPFDDLLTKHGQPVRASLDPPTLESLHPAAGIRIGDNAAIEFDRAGEFPLEGGPGAQAQLPLGRFRDKDAAVRQAQGRLVESHLALGVDCSDRCRCNWGFLFIAMVLAAMGGDLNSQGAAHEQSQGVAGKILDIGHAE
jgi:hypothetical protein